MPLHPLSAAKLMAEEPTKALESAAAQLEINQRVRFSGAGVAQPPLQQRSVHKGGSAFVLSLLFIVSPLPHTFRGSPSLCVSQ